MMAVSYQSAPCSQQNRTPPCGPLNSCLQHPLTSFCCYMFLGAGGASCDKAQPGHRQKLSTKSSEGGAALHGQLQGDGPLGGKAGVSGGDMEMQPLLSSQQAQQQSPFAAMSGGGAGEASQAASAGQALNGLIIHSGGWAAGLAWGCMVLGMCAGCMPWA